MSKTIIAKRYALGAMQFLPKDKYPEVFEQLQNVKKLFDENLEMTKFVSSAIVKNEDKIAFMKDVLQDMENNEFWIQMFTVLFSKNRGNLMDVFLIEFDFILSKELNRKNVKLTLANELDAPTMELIQKEVERIHGCKVFFQIEMDKSIVGGFIAESDSKFIDGSIRTNVNRFARRRVRIY